MTQTERQAVLNFKITGKESVGELKEHLKDLKKALNDTTIGSEDYKKSIEGIAQTQEKLTGVMTDSRVGVEKAKDSYYALNEQLVKLRKEYKSLSEEDRNGTIGTGKLEEIQKLDSQLKAMDATMGQYQRNVGHYQLALEALNKTYANSKQELAAMKTAMDNLDPETKEYAEAFQRAADITHKLQERQELLKYSSKDLGDQISNIRGIASNMAAGFSAVNAAMGLFGKESEDVQKAMLKVQQAMALVQGLQGMDGLIKRTQGLSTAIRGWRTETKAATVATQAETTATAAQTVATEGATVAQKGLNAAMKANPIGVIIIALQALITVWVLFKDKIIEALGGQEKLNAAFDKAKVVFMGVGNAIVQYIIGPVKMMITGIKGAAQVVEHILKGQFRQAWQAAGDTVVEWKDNFVKSVSFASNYEEAASKQRVKNAEAEAKKKKEVYDKDKDNYIKDQEAKHGSDWKYTDEGKKAYEELYKNRLELYKKDSEEYRQAQRDMWSYQHDYDERKKKADAEAAKAGAEAAKKLNENAKSVHDTFKKEVVDYLFTDSAKAFEKGANRMVALINEVVIKGGKGFDTLKGKADAIVAIGKPQSGIFDKLRKLIVENMDSIAKAGLGGEAKELLNEIDKEVAKPFVDKVLEYNNKVETKAKATAEQIANAFADEEFKRTLLYPSEAMQYAAAELGTYLDAYKAMTEQINETLDVMKSHGLEGTDEYKRLQVRLTEISNEESQKRMEYARKESDYVLKAYEDELTRVETQFGRMQAGFLNDIDKNTSPLQLMTGVMPEEEKRRMEESYNIFKEGMEKRKEVLQRMASDTSLSAEQRLSAERQLAETVAEIEDAEVAHTLQMNQQRADAWHFYVDMVSDSVQAIGDLFGSLADYYEADLDAKVKAGEMSEEQAEANFENIKSMRIAETVINTIAGSIGAFLQASENYPPPYGQILGGITAAAVAASGFAEIKKIRSSTRNGSGTGGGSTNYATVTPIQTDYVPQGTTNITNGQEVENLRNALLGANFTVSVSDINDAQHRVAVRDRESTF